MKNSIIKISGIAMLLMSTSCSKESCSYVTECVESEPEGYMVNTMSLHTGYTAMLFKTTYNSNAPIGSDWNDTTLGSAKVETLHPPMWTQAGIGNVFGIATNNSRGVFLSATDIYSIDIVYFPAPPSVYGSGGRAGIYYTDISNSSLPTSNIVKTGPLVIGTNYIPNSGIGLGNSLGNIAYDATNNQLFATNLEDGRIYRIDLSYGNEGKILSVFDPFADDDNVNGIAPDNEQLWGIGVLNNSGKVAVYFARTTSINLGSLNGTKEIWSIDLDSNGEFIANETSTPKIFDDTTSSLTLQIPNVPGTQYKVTDIAFSCEGRMLLAERGEPHDSKVLEYVNIGTSWIPGNNFYLANIASGRNSAGGVDYGSREVSGGFVKDDIVWATAYAMNHLPPIYGLYGVQGMSASGNSPILSSNTSTDIFIDYNSIYTTSDKESFGDVEIFDSSCPCNKK